MLEVTCGVCNGRLRVTRAGLVVACPHCGTHLSVPEELEQPIGAGRTDDVDLALAEADTAIVHRKAGQSSSQDPPETAMDDSHVIEHAKRSAEDSGANDDMQVPTDSEPSISAPLHDESVEVADNSDNTEAVADEFAFLSNADTGPTANPDLSDPVFDESEENGESADNESPGGIIDVQPAAPATDEPSLPNETVSQGHTGGPMETQPVPVGLPPAADSPDFSFLSEPVDGNSQQFEFEPIESDSPNIEITEEPARVAAPEPPTVDVQSEREPEPGPEPGPERETEPPQSATMSAPPSAPQSAADELTTDESVQDRPTPVSRVKSSSAESVSRTAFVLVASYASAITLAFIYTLLSSPRFHPLESLPDIAPISRTALQHVPADAELAPGHELRIGDTKRFGDVIVTPLRITQEMLEFDYYKADSTAKHPGDGPVLKLWFSFKNVSDSQSFGPLDSDLMSWRVDGATGPIANAFLAPLHERSAESLVLNYFHESHNEWSIRDQRAGSVLAPGQELTTFVASDADFSRLTEDGSKPLAWRVQFRKGIHSRSGHGVTTLIEVVFDPGQIEVRTPATAQHPFDPRAFRSAAVETQPELR